MNTAETVTLITVLGVLCLTALLLVASAQEWLNLSWSVSLRFIPASKRQPRTAVDVRVIPGVAEPAAEVKKIGSARGTA